MSTSDKTEPDKREKDCAAEESVEQRIVVTRPAAQDVPTNSDDSRTPTFKDHPVWLITALLFATILGNGAFWQWRSSKLANKDSELKQEEANLTKVVKTTELRKSENEMYRQVIELSQEFADTRDQHLKAPSSTTNNKMITLKNRLELIKSDFLVLETQLAELERREPRRIALEFIPPSAPTGLRIVK